MIVRPSLNQFGIVKNYFFLLFFLKAIDIYNVILILCVGLTSSIFYIFYRYFWLFLFKSINSIKFSMYCYSLHKYHIDIHIFRKTKKADCHIKVILRQSLGFQSHKRKSCGWQYPHPVGGPTRPERPRPELRRALPKHHERHLICKCWIDLGCCSRRIWFGFNFHIASLFIDQ